MYHHRSEFYVSSALPVSSRNCYLFVCRYERRSTATSWRSDREKGYLIDLAPTMGITRRRTLLRHDIYIHTVVLELSGYWRFAHTDDRLAPRPAMLKIIEALVERVQPREQDRLELARGKQCE